jgi:hypothetical protein
MNLQPRKGETIYGKKEFMRNAHNIEYKTAGATLDSSAFTAGQYVKAGTAVYKDGVSGLFVPWAGATVATEEAAALLADDTMIYADQNPVVGLVSGGHPREDRCTGVNAAFKEATKGRLIFDI